LNSGSQPLTIYTIGHSTRTLEGLIQMLRSFEIRRLIDVRTIPRSRANPQFNIETFGESLRPSGIGYEHFPELGGLRHARRDSPNTGWRNTSFRGFADYMGTPDFTRGIDRLLETARHDCVAIMCAEAVPWRCHRSLIADALLVRGVRVEHILGERRSQPHAITPFASVCGLEITYPGLPDSAPPSRAPSSSSRGGKGQRQLP
jgi:uncharacterized protein (DUF488 family)